MAAKASIKKQLAKRAESKAHRVRDSNNGGLYDEGEDLNLLPTLIKILHTTRDVQGARREKIRVRYDRKCRQSQSMIREHYHDAKQHLLRRQSDRIQNLAKLARDQALLEAQILQRVQLLEGTYQAAKEDVLAVLKGRLEDLRE